MFRWLEPLLKRSLSFTVVFADPIFKTNKTITNVIIPDDDNKTQWKKDAIFRISARIAIFSAPHGFSFCFWKAFQRIARHIFCYTWRWRQLATWENVKFPSCRDGRDFSGWGPNT